MKESKREIKYIIRRILIGVGIAIILFNLKKCNAYALSVENFYYPNSGKVPVHGTYSSSTLGFEYTFNQNDYILGDLKVIFKIRNLSVFRPNSYVIFENTDGVVYLLPVDGSPTNYNISVNDAGYYCQDTSQNNTCNNTTFTELVAIRPASAGFTFVNIGSTSTFTNSSTGSVFAYNFGNPFSVNFSFNKDIYRVIDTNIPNLTIDNTNWDEYYDSDPLKNFTEIDITGYQAILITPKNYLQLSNLDGNYEYNSFTQELFLKYKFGYQRCVKATFINIEDVSDFYTIDSWQQGLVDNVYDTANLCAEEPTLYEEKVLYNSPELDSTDTPYRYRGILVYNNSINYSTNEPDWVNNQVNPYGANSVWVDTSLYNYYLISSFLNFNQDISYIDSNGDSKTTHIDSLPSFTEMVESNISQDSITDNLSTRQKIDYLLSFVKLPFDFLKSILTGTCEPLTAQFPHSNSNIVLPCLSGQFESFLGTAGFNIIRYLINALLIYRITMSLVVFGERSLDPSDARIEVLDL